MQLQTNEIPWPIQRAKPTAIGNLLTPCRSGSGVSELIACAYGPGPVTTSVLSLRLETQDYRTFQ